MRAAHLGEATGAAGADFARMAISTTKFPRYSYETRSGSGRTARDQIAAQLAGVPLSLDRVAAARVWEASPRVTGSRCSSIPESRIATATAMETATATEARTDAGSRRAAGRSPTTAGARPRTAPASPSGSSALATGARTCCACSPTRQTCEVRWICDLAPDRLERFARRYPSVQATERVRRPARRPDARRGPDRDAGVHPRRARPREPRGRQAHLRREAARGLRRGGRASWPARSRARASC